MMKKEIKTRLVIGFGSMLLFLIAGAGIFYWQYRKNNFNIPIELFRRNSPDWVKKGKYWETSQFSTPNLRPGNNEVKAIVLHHTASRGTGEMVARDLCATGLRRSCHVVIDTDGTRYVLADPERITFHAGYSKLGDRFRVNNFAIGIEFHGNTLERPLTNEQIESVIEYLRPIIAKYNIKAKNLVTHQLVRDSYRQAIPGTKEAYPKVDITTTEYERVIHALDTANLLK